GDEFVAILQDINELSRISNITERMLKCFDTPVDISSTEIFSSICIGVALYPDDDNGEHLLKYADAAMYHAKEQGGNNYQFYNEKLTQQIQQRLNMETRLRHALEREEFVLFYQPIFSLKDQSIIGVEALIRWNDPEHGLIMPDSFIPLAEETGLIVAIGDWVLKHACLQAKKWEAEGFGSLHLAINVASLQFEHDRLYWSVVSTLKDSGFPAQQLELEITERMFLNISGTVRETLDKLTAKGVKLSIDDFGTGYSSLSYLKQLPINTLKIDRSFIMGIPGDKDDVQITATIITMAHGLNMDVVAEGIETEYQLEYLNSLGCGRGQGYYLSKPLSVEDITSLLKTRLNG
ncbi:MAG: bifunctional diguanylate cyclase/phosphodiesterase, partial [Gammaproteobacteria bacterium]|nr:bifunctional diguanylate cyclase/phosphodiesterase [Gammaproteobacteria bacterium]